jgi:hypothetical protein
MNPPAVENGQCQCQADHHHKPGECDKKGSTERENLCDDCYQYLLAARAGALQPFFTPQPHPSMRWREEAIMQNWWPSKNTPLTLEKALPEQDPFYALVGRVASEWAHLEHILDTTIWGLLSIEEKLGASVTSQIMGVSPRCKAIITLCVARGVNEPTWKPFAKLMSDSFDVSEWRNRFVHDYWAMPEQGKATQFRAMAFKDKRFGFVDIGKEALNKTIEETKKLQQRASYLHATVVEALKALQEASAQ